MSNECQGFEVEPEELAQHAAGVRRVAERVRGAHTAAAQVGGGHWQMYGVLLGLMARAQAHLATRTTDGVIGSAADLIEACADGVDDERLCYEQLDQQVADLLVRTGVREGEGQPSPWPPPPTHQWG